MADGTFEAEAPSGYADTFENYDAGDATWILTSAFMIMTMQSGFGLLESGMVCARNEANIMMKNVVDVAIGGLIYWSFGYALSHGEPSGAFAGYGNFFLTPDVEENPAKVERAGFEPTTSSLCVAR